MVRIGTTLFCGFLVAGMTWGCSSESTSTSETQNVAEETKSEAPTPPVASPTMADAERPDLPKVASEMPELFVPARTTNSQDVAVHPASAVELSIPVAPVPKVPKNGNAGQRAFFDLVEAFHTGQPDKWTRAEAAIHASGPSVVPTLLDGLQSSDQQTRELASMMLAQVLPNILYPEDLSQQPKITPIADRLRLGLQDESVEVRVNVAVALSLMEGEGPKLVPIFQQLLTSELPQIRTMSVVALGGLGSHAVPAIPAMERMSQTDPDPNAKSAAMESLKLLRSQR